jgi:ABC-2 type transport system ATP-binding protein
MQHVIQARGVCKSYGGAAVVDDVSLSVARGEIVGLLGPNGAGKTTLVECLLGLRRRDAGEICLLGRDPGRHGAALRGRIGVQLQGAVLPDRLRVREALWMFAAYYPAPADPEALLRSWGLDGLERRAYADLSAGERQRLFLALAMLSQPELVVLDELTTALDATGRRETWALMRRLRADGLSVLLVTHDLDEAQRLCDRVGVLRAGRLVALGPPAQVAQGARLEDAVLELAGAAVVA